MQQDGSLVLSFVLQPEDFCENRQLNDIFVSVDSDK